MRPLALLLLATLAAAETIPPGDYSDTGRVVKTARGVIELFDGRARLLTLSEKLQARLAPHVGEFVRVDYTRVADREGELWDRSGAPIGRIRKITKLTSPVRVTVRPATPAIALGEPVQVRVTFVNDSAAPFDLRLSEGECNLLQDYRWCLTLQPEDRRLRTRSLRAGETFSITITSAWLARPGRYDAVYTLRGTVQSDPVPVEVLPAEDDDARRAALRLWLTRADPAQRVRIAEQLIALGDRAGVAEVMKLLDTKLYSHSPVYRFLWKHGGAPAEERLLALLRRCKDQDRALRVIEDVYRSPRRIALLEGFLADRRELSRDIAGWCDRPRLCDITAEWLAGYTNGAMTFPRGGTETERDAAVAGVLRLLRDKPSAFEVLTRDD